MTSGGSKLDHPQARLLLSLVRSGLTYAEIGCGSGEIAAAVAETASVKAYDISPIAIGNAKRRYNRSDALFSIAPAGRLPLEDSSVDGVYSFEVMEHLWDPLGALAEMARVVKPRGFILISCPNRFSLDLHLNKRGAVRAAEKLCALGRYIQDKITGTAFVSLIPDIDANEIYPDCDMISSPIPHNLTAEFRRLACKVHFCDTYYMCAHSGNGLADLQFQRNSGRPFLKWFGDHMLVLATRETVVETEQE